MRRRTLVKTTAVFATAAIPTVTGCADSESSPGSGDTDSDSGGCDTPDGELTTAFPESDAYEQLSSASVPQDGDVEPGGDAEAYATASYMDSEDRFFAFGIYQYPDADTATERSEGRTETFFERNQGADSTVGYITVDAYVYVGVGPDDSSLVDFMQRAAPLSDCVEDRIEYL
jgi:hypothetical protein